MFELLPLSLGLDEAPFARALLVVVVVIVPLLPRGLVLEMAEVLFALFETQSEIALLLLLLLLLVDAKGLTADGVVVVVVVVVLAAGDGRLLKGLWFSLSSSIEDGSSPFRRPPSIRDRGSFERARVCVLAM